MGRVIPACIKRLLVREVLGATADFADSCDCIHGADDSARHGHDKAVFERRPQVMRPIAQGGLGADLVPAREPQGSSVLRGRRDRTAETFSVSAGLPQSWVASSSNARRPKSASHTSANDEPPARHHL